jgi:outer membrane protein assembly factor BamB
MRLPALLLFISCSAANAADWPSFRGNGDGITTAKNLPLKWSDSEGVAWVADIAGYGQSSPIVIGNQAFVTSVEGATKTTLHVSAFDITTGKPLWKHTAQGTQGVEDSDYVSKAAPTPVADEQRLVAFFESGDILALDHDGKLPWQRSLTKDYGEFKGNHGVGSSLAQTTEHVIALIDHAGPSYVIALDKQTGKTAWKVDRPQRVSWSSPIIAKRGQRSEILISSNGIVQALDAKDGSTVWSGEGVKGNTVASPTPTKDAVVIGSSEAGLNMAITRDHKGDLHDRQILWRSEQATSSFASPLVFSDVAYFISKPGVAFAVDMATGKDLWSHRLGDSCWASPIGDTAGQRVYFFCKGGRTIVVGAGKELNVLADQAMPVEGRVYGVAPVDGAFLLRTGRKLICVGKPG